VTEVLIAGFLFVNATLVYASVLAGDAVTVT